MPSHAVDPASAPRTGPSNGSGLAVEAKGLEKAYGDHVALSGVDLAVPEGEIVGFIGPSGSGKTTTVRLLTGIERPDAGEVRVLGGDPVAFSADERGRIGYMPQLSVLFPSLSLRENLTFVASIYGMPLRRRAALRSALELVELHEHRTTRLRDASGGMQRRLALAAALVHDPPLLFLDEPTAGIDPVLRRRFWEHFAELRAQGRTLFVTTQYVTEASYCDRVAVLNNGRVLVVGTPDELRRRAFGGELLDVETAESLPGEVLDDLLAIDGVRDARALDPGRRLHRLIVDDADTVAVAVRQMLDARRLTLEVVREEQPSFDDVFVALVQADGDDAAAVAAGGAA
jgi:ABC-2 type transport system ATP-binding protein